VIVLMTSYVITNCQGFVATIQVAIQQLVMQSSWGEQWPELVETDFERQMLCAFSFLIFLNFAVLSMSFFAMEWFYQRRVSKMTGNNACNIPAVMWGVNWAILCVAFFVMCVSAVTAAFSMFATAGAWGGKGVCNANLTDLHGTVNELLAAFKTWVCDEAAEHSRCHRMAELCARIPESVTEQDVELMCDTYDKVSKPMMKLTCIAFWVAFAQLIVAIVQRANIATHNARRGYAKRFFEEVEDSDEDAEGLLVNETRAVKMERVNDTTDGGKILI